MVRREIEIDESTDRLLSDLAIEYDGDLGIALSDLLHAREGMEEIADRSEEIVGESLRLLRDRSESDFRAGRVVTWDDVKLRNKL
ncbi:MAG: hypothetical protein U0R19_15975 [Bryobacteraceae bacterium]